MTTDSANKRRERYASDPEYREKIKAANRAAFKRRYYEDEAWREAFKEKTRVARQAKRRDPAYRDAEREKNRNRERARRARLREQQA